MRKKQKEEEELARKKKAQEAPATGAPATGAPATAAPATAAPEPIMLEITETLAEPTNPTEISSILQPISEENTITTSE
jgi:hypothetical protein